MEDMVRLENWSVVTRNPYMAPEVSRPHLAGIAHGHRRRPEPHSVVTSRIVEVSGRIITTWSGTKYRLGKIDPEYRKALRNIAPNWDWRKPITMKGSSHELS